MAKQPEARGLDCGTMFFQIAEQDAAGETLIKTTRNAFVEIKETEDIEEELRRNQWQYVKDGNHYYVIGEDSIRVANMFPGTELRRPLQDGVLNKDEGKKMLILNELIKTSIGRAPTTTSVICTCVSSESADGSVDSKFHKARLMGMIKNLGWNVKVIEEGFAVVLSERPVMIEEGKEIPYSGIGISFGAGRVNCVAAWRGRQIDGLGMSVARSGDWIDTRVAEATGRSVNQVTRIKERQLDFDNIDYDDDVIFALDTYYGDMIRYVFEKFSIRFQKVRPEFEAPVSIVLAGGSAAPKGFCSKVQDVVGDLSLPFEIKEVKMASNPLDAVVTGCLTQALITQKKVQKDRSKDLEGMEE